MPYNEVSVNNEYFNDNLIENGNVVTLVFDGVRMGKERTFTALKHDIQLDYE